MAKKIDEFGQLEYWVLDNGILELRPSSLSAKELSLEEVLYAQKVQKAYQQQHKKKLRVLARLDNISNLSKEARVFGKSPESKALNDIMAGIALLAPNTISRMIGSMLLTVYRQDYPAKLFKNREEAIAWLLSLED